MKIFDDIPVADNNLFKRSTIMIKHKNEEGVREYDIFVGDGEWMITNYDVVNIYDNYEEFKELLAKLIMS